jgi:hypothetical protein
LYHINLIYIKLVEYKKILSTNLIYINLVEYKKILSTNLIYINLVKYNKNIVDCRLSIVDCAVEGAGRKLETRKSVTVSVSRVRNQQLPLSTYTKHVHVHGS